MASELTTQTCDPLDAKMWFNLRTPINWTISIFLFAVLVLVWQNFLYPFFADVLALGVVSCLSSFFSINVRLQ